MDSTTMKGTVQGYFDRALNEMREVARDLRARFRMNAEVK